MSSTDKCERCGKVHGRCKGHNRAGGPCGRIPRKGLTVCPTHGGSAPQVKEAAKRRELEAVKQAEARKLLRRERWRTGHEVRVEDPLEELSIIAGEAVAFKDLLRAEVEKLEQLTQEWSDKAVEMMTEDGMRRFAVVKEDVRAVVAAYERALDRCAKILADIVKLGLTERLLELRTAQAEAIVAAVRLGLGQVDMASEIRLAAESAIADAIGEMTQPGPTPKELTA